MVFINGVAAFLPGAPFGNEDLGRVLGPTSKRGARAKEIVLKKNGIKTRHYAVDPETGTATFTNAMLAAEAIRALVREQRVSLEEVDLLACGTTCADQLLPSHGSMVHGELGSHVCEVITTAGVCCSSVAALKYAYLSLLSGDKSRAVVTGSEISSKFMRASRFGQERLEDLLERPIFQFEQEFLRWMLSDGAGAVLLERSPSKSGLSMRVDWIELLSYANELPVCMYGGAKKSEDQSLISWMDFSRQELMDRQVMNISQDSRLLEKFITDYSVNHALRDIRYRRSLRSHEIDWFVPHYSSDFFRSKLFTHLQQIEFEIPFSKWFTTLESRGNVGSASLFVYLNDLCRSGMLQPGQKILCFVPESSRFTICYMQLTVLSNGFA